MSEPVPPWAAARDRELVTTQTPPEFFFGIVKGDSFNSERIPLDQQRAPPARRAPCPTGQGAKAAGLPRHPPAGQPAPPSRPVGGTPPPLGGFPPLF